MENIDKFRAMSAEELAKYLVVNCNHCVHKPNCSYIDDDTCHDGIARWLNQEVNPMPELKVGYIISSYYPATNNTVNYVYLGNNVLWCGKDEIFVKFENNMKKFIRAIYRKDVDDFSKVELWRADNG